MKNRVIALTVACVVAALAGCHEGSRLRPRKPARPDYSRPLGPGQWALRKITDPAKFPDFTSALADTAGLRQALARSMNYLAKPTSRKWYSRGFGGITHEQVVSSLKAFDALLTSGKAPAEMNQAVRRDFDVYMSVGWNGQGVVLFTGYYTPIFRASLVRTTEFACPLYAMPADLVKDEYGTIVGRRGPDGVTISKYPSRAEIETSGMLAGKELVYLSDPFEAYICHVQGSARLRLADGEMMSVGYTANNGHEYRSVGRMLVDEGKIDRDKLSLQAMIDYFKANPHQVDRYVRANPRFVFFAVEAGPARGSLNEPVTPMRTIATDKEVYPPAALAFVSTRLARRVADRIRPVDYRGFALDQDTGGAIRAPGRCDLYIGVGDEAGQLAGRTYAEGRLYYLFLKPGR